jgi:acetolactate synthase regulatory subunit
MQKFNLTIETESNHTILNRIVQVFSRKRINIQELSMISCFDSKYITLTIGPVQEDIGHTICLLEKQIDIINVTCQELVHPTI